MCAKSKRPLTIASKKLGPRNCQIADKAAANPETAASANVEKKSLQRATTVEVARPTPQAEATVRQMLLQAGGVTDPELAARIVGQVARIQGAGSFDSPADCIKAAGEMMLAMKPKGLAEALLFTQMLGVHQAAISSLQRSVSRTNTLAEFDLATNVTQRLVRLFMDQLDAMAKLQAKKGLRELTVERVHVHEQQAVNCLRSGVE